MSSSINQSELDHIVDGVWGLAQWRKDRSNDRKLVPENRGFVSKDYAKERLAEIIEAECLEREESWGKIVADVAKQQLLDELEKELPIAERLAWSDEDGSQMTTRVFQTNMKAWISVHRTKTPDYELAYCDVCQQMTNHLSGVCAKHGETPEQTKEDA